MEMLVFYAGFEINEQTGEALSDHEMTDIHYNKIIQLQVDVMQIRSFVYYPQNTISNKSFSKNSEVFGEMFSWYYM